MTSFLNESATLYQNPNFITVFSGYSCDPVGSQSNFEKEQICKSLMLQFKNLPNTYIDQYIVVLA